MLEQFFSIVVNVSAYHKGQMITGAKARDRGWKQRLWLHELKPELEQKRPRTFLHSEGQRDKQKHCEANHAKRGQGWTPASRVASADRPTHCRSWPGSACTGDRTVTHGAKGALHIATNYKTKIL